MLLIGAKSVQNRCEIGLRDPSRQSVANQFILTNQSIIHDTCLIISCVYLRDVYLDVRENSIGQLRENIAQSCNCILQSHILIIPCVTMTRTVLTHIVNKLRKINEIIVISSYVIIFVSSFVT